MISLRIKNIAKGFDDIYTVDAEVTSDNPATRYFLETIYKELGPLDTFASDSLSYQFGELTFGRIDYYQVCRGILVLSLEVDETVHIEVEEFLFEQELYMVATKYFGFEVEGGNNDV